MKASGMCGSDLHSYRRPKGGSGTRWVELGEPGPVIAGHEPCGVIAAVGPALASAGAGRARVMVHHYQG